MIFPFCFCFCLWMLAIGVFTFARWYFCDPSTSRKKQMIRRSVQYLIYTMVKYLMMQFIIITGMQKFIRQRIHCLRQVGDPSCTSNWYRQNWRNRVWWVGSRHISEVTIEHLCVGLCSRAPPIGGHDNSHTSPLQNTTPSWRGITVCPAFYNGHDCLIYVLRGRFETGYHRLVLRIGNIFMWYL